ncbi:BTB/POZ domain-containing protein [Rhizophagus irregularis DAOM 181602=DAOM 197198]|nr:BTB/POZ domain-containing protein [Rhizophagus irregularis DAOM 181602=DAOM 197198]
MSWQENVNDDYEKLFEADEGYDYSISNPHIEEYLIKHQYEFLQQNPIGILETIYQYETFTSLLDYCLNKICEEPEILFNTDKFINLKTPIIELLIKQDDLWLKEIEIWDNLLKWTFAQTPNISKDVTKWNKEEVTIMERTLHRSEDFHDKVFPYKEILPKDLINNLFTIYLVPNRKTNIKMIQNTHYNFYRSSSDGNTIAKFHEKTDNKGANIVVAKIKNTNQIIGGYNPLDWSMFNNRMSFRITADSFIFSFKDYKNTDTGKIGRVIKKEYAISSSYGPIFGSSHIIASCCDIELRSNGSKWSSYPNCYPDIDIPINYETEDYKVFQVVKRIKKQL